MGCNDTSARRLHKFRNSMISCTVAATWMSLTNLQSVKTSTTLLLLDILLGIMTAIRGAWSLICCPDSHLSFQNRVLVPSPTSKATTMEKNACNLALTCIGNEAHGLLGSIFLSHNYFSLCVQYRILRSEIPSPPISFGRVTFGQAIKQYLFALATYNSDESC
jgi:hypothetical protein